MRIHMLIIFHCLLFFFGTFLSICRWAHLGNQCTIVSLASLDQCITGVCGTRYGWWFKWKCLRVVLFLAHVWRLHLKKKNLFFHLWWLSLNLRHIFPSPLLPDVHPPTHTTQSYMYSLSPSHVPDWTHRCVFAVLLSQGARGVCVGCCLVAVWSCGVSLPGLP